MPKWIIEKVWDGKEVFIVGGGESLRNFNWDLLKPLRTIGCNTAYQHETDLCFFGDKKWWKEHKDRLQEFKGITFTNCPQLQKDKTSWLWILGRRSRGLHHDALGWNGNTGAGAVNLALLLGATRIFLLGFDMHLSKDGKSNWHDQILDKPNPMWFPKFIKGFEYVAKDLVKKFPGVEVINITDNSSLEVFPKIGVKKFWSQHGS